MCVWGTACADREPVGPRIASEPPHADAAVVSPGCVRSETFDLTIDYEGRLWPHTYTITNRDGINVSGIGRYIYWDDPSYTEPFSGTFDGVNLRIKAEYLVNGVPDGYYEIYSATVDENGDIIGEGNSSFQTFVYGTITGSFRQTCAPPIAIPGGPYSGSEAATITFDATGSSDPAGKPLEYRWSFGDGSPDATEAKPIHAYADNGTYTVTLTVSNGNLSSTAVTTARVDNVAPAVGLVTAPSDPMQVTTAASLSAAFTDQGTADTHTASVEWGDGTSTAASVTEAAGSGNAAATHLYSQAGVYTVTVTVTDDDGGVAQSVYSYVVVYDPSAGFITGGGWILSPAAACKIVVLCGSAAEGKASFGFVSGYQHGASVPTGNTEFVFHAGRFGFSSSSYQWLVIAGAKAQYKGSGTINGAGDYGFMLSATDGEMPGGDGIDRFRIKIWDKSTGAVIYDNVPGGSDDPSANMQALGGGSIQIHAQ